MTRRSTRSTIRRFASHNNTDRAATITAARPNPPDVESTPAKLRISVPSTETAPAPLTSISAMTMRRRAG